MKTHNKKWMLIFGKFTCVMAMALAILSVNSTCGFTAYQPDVPESLKRIISDNKILIKEVIPVHKVVSVTVLATKEIP